MDVINERPGSMTSKLDLPTQITNPAIQQKIHNYRILKILMSFAIKSSMREQYKRDKEKMLA
jgi:hypothetical protein